MTWAFFFLVGFHFGVLGGGFEVTLVMNNSIEMESKPMKWNLDFDSET